MADHVAALRRSCLFQLVTTPATDGQISSEFGGRKDAGTRARLLQLKPNTHLRRRRDETVLSRRVGVGGVYMNSRRLPTDSAIRTHNAAVGRDRVYNTAANGSRLPTGVFTPPTRRDATRQFRLVRVGGVCWALATATVCCMGSTTAC